MNDDKLNKAVTQQDDVISFLSEQIRLRKMTITQANVEKVKMLRVEVIRNKLPRDVRKALNDAVKLGTLKHLKKEEHKPECYYHPDFEHLAKQARNEAEKRIIEALKNIISADECNSRPE